MAVIRGSRKHVLDWTEADGFLEELRELVAPVPVEITNEAQYMPRGYSAPKEARLETFGPRWLPTSLAWQQLRNWWLSHPAGANTPNWDIAVGCTIEERPALILVEAKANWPELTTSGKRLSKDASQNSHENHERIKAAIEEASRGWKEVSANVSLSIDEHYQLANRLAFAWKLATLGIPVVLVYLGFIGDEGIRDAGEPFSSDADWQRAFREYASSFFPEGLLDQRTEFNSTAVWVQVRSRPVVEVSPPRDEKQ